jgi:ribosomal protein S7
MNKILFLDKVTNYLILCNKLQKNGLKERAFTRLLFLLEKVKVHFKADNQYIFDYLFTILPVYVYIYKKKIGGNVHQIPLYLKKEIRLKKGFSNFFKVINSKKGKNLNRKLMNEIIDIKTLKSSTIITRDNIYMTAMEERSNMRFLRPRRKKIPVNFKKFFIKKKFKNGK